MADYKQLCAELLDRLEGLYNELVDSEMGWVPPEAQELMTRTRAALAEPEPEGPTREEICHLMYEFTIGTGHGERLDEIGFAHALLARWGK